MIWSISWRNIWRSRVRSIVILSAIALGLFAGVYSVAFMVGWVNQRVDNIIATESSHIQIHHPEYLKSNDVKDYIANINDIRKKVENEPEVKAAAERVIVNAMVSSAETGSGIQLIGVEPEKEMQVTDLHEKIIKGSYLNQEHSNQIVIGEALAKKLKVKVKSKIVITLTEMDGTLTGGSFRVSGIFKTANTAYDEMKAFVKADDLRDLIRINENSGHEVAILLNKNDTEERVAQNLKGSLTDVDVKTWSELMPEMQMMNENMDFMMYFFVGIILLALGFGIVNTMLMVILERVKELGMLMAIGMNRKRIFGMIMLETVLLSLTGGAIGITLALIVTSITQHTGIDLSLWAAGLNAYGFNSVIYPEIGLASIIEITFLVMGIGVLAAIYPARKAIKLNPAEAIKTDN
ncbi:MAG: FtsX-like permease family protein [Perlabentimonas sp.]